MYVQLSSAETTYILVVEDEDAIRQMLLFSLSRTGYHVTESADCSGARSILEDRLPDLVLLDWMLPDYPGLDLLAEIRRNPRTRDLPVMMLTARAAESDRICAFQAGADDYIIKPFSREELLLRVRAVLRRTRPNDTSGKISVGPLTVDPRSHRVKLGDEFLNFGRLEFRLLHFMMMSPNRVFSRTQLLDHVWHNAGYVEKRTVDVHVMRIRTALGRSTYGSGIETIRGIGYRFSPDRILALESKFGDTSRQAGRIGAAT